MSGGVLDAVPPAYRAIIVEELARLNPGFLDELRETREPTNDQSDTVVDILCDALSENFEPGHIPNERGKAIDNAIGAYLSAWPIHR